MAEETEISYSTVEKYIAAYLYSDMDRFLSQVRAAFEERLKQIAREVASDLMVRCVPLSTENTVEVRVFFNGKEHGEFNA